jgi:dTDP-4-amino-4,6-dideoxygalactose transaminase
MEFVAESAQESRLGKINGPPAIAGGKPAFSRKVPILSPEGIGDFDVREEFEAVLQSKVLTNGTRVRAFEEAAAHYLGVPHCVAVSSCSAGLLLVLRALGVRGEVILPSFTFHVTAHAAVWNGLKPVFADCEPDTFCLSPASVREKLTPRSAAILAVHMYGHPADVEALEAIADQRGIALVFDAAHAFGSEYDSKRIGGFGTAEIFSFSPTKLLVAAEGGLIATRDEALAKLLRAGRNYGDAGNYDPDMVGINARMSELHAALALRGRPGIGARLHRRNEIRLRYERNLRSVPGLAFQRIRPRCSSTCKDFSILVDAAQFGAPRDWLVEALTRENIEVKRYFWPPVHRQRLYRNLWDGQTLPATDWISGRVISLPIYSALPDASVDRICDAIARAQDFTQKRGIEKAMQL